MKSKFIALLMTVTILFSLVPGIKSNAEDITIYYLHDVIDFTKLQAGDYNTDLNNYNLNFNDVSGYLKNDINYGDGSWTGSNFSNVFVNNNLIDKWVNSVNNDYTVSNQNTVNFKGIESPDIVVNGDVLDRSHYKTIIATDGGDNMPSGSYIIICSVFVPDDTICFLEQGRLMTSKNDVYYAYNIYQFYIDGDYLSFSKWGNTSSGTNSYYTTYDFDQNNTPDLYQLYVTLNGWFYSDIPVYYSWADHSSGEGAFLNQSPYYYGDYNGRGGTSNSVGKYVLSGDDNTGFVIDRRTAAMINIDDNSNNNEIVQDGFDPKLFNGELGFNSFNASASLNYNSTTDLYEPFFDIKYQPNNYTEINIEDITLYYQAEVFLKLTLSKNMTNFYYTSTRYKTSGQGSLDRSGTSPNANRYEFILYAMSNPPLGNATWNNTSTRSSAGINTQFGISTFTGNNIDYDISVGVSAFKHNNYVVVPSESEALEMINDYLNGKNGNVENKSYGYYKIQMYIKNNVTGDISTTYSSIFDLFGNKISDNSSSMINNDDQAYNDFVNDFYYLDKDGDLTPVDYADRINSYGGNSSVGDITIYQNPYSYVLVDIPENEWMSYTPNLRTLLTEFKTMLAEVHDESVLKMLPETYNYLPAPFMKYMLYGVGLIVMIGIWRAITRR